MDAVGTAVGVASFGIQICEGLLSYYDGWKGYHTDISSTYASIADLAQIFTVLRPVLKESETSSKSEVRTTVDRCLDSCIEGLYRLQSRLSKLQSYGKPKDLRQKTWAEMQRAWYPFRAKTLTKLKKDVSELQDRLSLALQILQQTTLDRGLNRMIDMMLRLLSEQQESEKRASAILANQQTALNKIEDVLSAQQAMEQKAIIDWLCPPDPWYNHNAARKRHEPGTGLWLLESDQYKDWKTSNNAILWLTGKAGSGKTVLCSTAVEDIRTLPNTRLAFFYFSFSDVQKQSYARFLSSLIAQLARDRAAYSRLHQAYSDTASSKPSTAALEAILSAFLQQPEQTTLVLDALDELPEGDSNDGRPAVLEWLERIMQDNGQTRIFMTSRQLTDIQTCVESIGARRVLLQSKFANRDIGKYVAAELEKHPKLSRFNSHIKETVKEVFKQKADGMFRWAFCQLEMLKNLKSTKPKFIEKALHDLPHTLDETYERMLVQIDEMLQDEALTALRWLVFETRPLTLRELAEACLITYEDEQGLFDVDNRGQLDDVLDILAGLVLVEDMQHLGTEKGDDNSDIDGNDGYDSEPSMLQNEYQAINNSEIARVDPNSRIRLAHFSIKEYLLSSRVATSKAAKFALDQDRDYPILAQSCLAYVLYYSRSSFKTRSERDLYTYPLLQYAAKTWYIFIPKHSSTQPTYERRLLENEVSRCDWLSIYDPDDRWKRPFDESRSDFGPPLYYASLLGIVPLCHMLIQQGANVNALGGFYGTPLQAASEKGHAEIIHLLLDNGADVNARGGGHASPLLAASIRGYQDIAQLLLDRGADIELVGQDVWHDDRSALCAASAAGHLGIMQLLLDRGANVNVQVGDRGNALQAASERGYRDAVQLLLDRGADITITHEGYYGSALQAASARGSCEVAQLLIDRGADVNARGGHYSYALLAASSQGSREVVQLLLDEGADVEKACGGYYGNVFHAASEHGHREIVQLLLDRGLDVKIALGGYYGNPLQAASAGGHQEVVRLLLDAGADVNAEGGFFGNALQAASARGFRNIVQLLLDKGADVNARGGHFTNSLQAAIVEGSQEVVQLLKGAGADPDVAEQFHVLQSASLNTDQEITQPL